MKSIIFTLIAGFFIVGCSMAQSPKSSQKKASNNAHLAKETSNKSTKKPKQSYKSYKYHDSYHVAPEKNDVTVDKSLKNAKQAKKVNSINSDKNKRAQATYLNELNKGTRYKTSKVNTGQFGFY